MHVLRGLHERPAFRGGSVVAIGNFDGLHLGHQRILRFLVEKARERRLISLVLTFSPHPERVLETNPVAMIQTLEQRLAGLRSAGVRAVLLASFDQAFARLTSAEFIGRVVVSSLSAKELVVGENFRFGRDRQGDVDDLRRFGQRLGFAVSPIAPAIRNGEVVSSSLIRHLLDEGRISAANVLLGRPYEIVGRVVRGAGRGRGLGFPTANIQTPNEILPQGVYLTEAEIVGRYYPSLTNIGHRPTFGGGRLQVETHVFDFQGTLYHRRIGLRFLRKLREEKKHPDPEGLVTQVREDIGIARAYFAKRGMSSAGESPGHRRLTFSSS
jgi:riboflavin kinase/FMN adenylyltransferase